VKINGSKLFKGPFEILKRTGPLSHNNAYAFPVLLGDAEWRQKNTQSFLHCLWAQHAHPCTHHVDSWRWSHQPPGFLEFSPPALIWHGPHMEGCLCIPHDSFWFTSVGVINLGAGTFPFCQSLRQTTVLWSPRVWPALGVVPLSLCVLPLQWLKKGPVCFKHGQAY
jgi:hypothetical protein